MSVRRLLVVVLCIACAPSFATERAATLKERLKAQAEQMALQALPTNEFHQALGFFGPVTKKYLPVFRQFNAEYIAAADKLPVVVKYLPKAEAAVAEARRMKVPPKYEAKKEEYLRMIDAFMATVGMSVKMFGK